MSTFDTDQFPLAGELVSQNAEDWTPELIDEFSRKAFDGHVGGRLLSETDDVRVWEIRLEPGERHHVHRHVLDYFWTAIEPGESVQHTSDGSTRRVSYTRGETRHFHFGPGEFLLHDLENSGPTPLVFSTVEFMKSSNSPLPL